jgi:acyl carrier protein
MRHQTNNNNTLDTHKADVIAGVFAELARLTPCSRREIFPDSDVASELDSLDAIGLVLALNGRFGIDLPEDSLSALRTPESIAALILQLTEGQARYQAITSCLKE